MIEPDRIGGRKGSNPWLNEKRVDSALTLGIVKPILTKQNLWRNLLKLNCYGSIHNWQLFLSNLYQLICFCCAYNQIQLAFRKEVKLYDEDVVNLLYKSSNTNKERLCGNVSP